MVELVVVVSILLGLQVFTLARLFKLENEVDILNDFAELESFKVGKLVEKTDKFDISF